MDPDQYPPIDHYSSSTDMLPCSYFTRQKCVLSCWATVGEFSPRKCAFELVDFAFFNETEMLEIVKGVKEFDSPIIRANRKMVASVNGGLSDPSYVVFNSGWGRELEAQNVTKRFNHPCVCDLQKPKSEEDIAFMSILGLRELIRTKKFTSKELTRIFLKRLKKVQITILYLRQ